MMTEIEMQKKSRASHKSVATKYWTEAEHLLQSTRSVSLPDALIRLEQLHKNLSRKQAFLNDLNSQIQAKFDNEDALEADIMQSEEYDDKLMQQLDQIDRFIKANTMPATSSTSTFLPPPVRSTTATTKLPKLDLPTFTGDYLTWTSFIDLFRGAVHNNTALLDSQKLQYLKASLKGDAAKLLASVTITDANYSVAMRMLRDRYQNERMILRAHVHAIATQKQLSNETAKDLRQLLETVEEHRLALENLGQPVDQQDVFLVYLITEKLPAETRKFWELSTPGTCPQTYNDLKKFLEARCLALEAANLSTSSPSTQVRFVSRQGSQSQNTQRSYNNNTSTSETKCECCNADHKLHLCPKFKQLSVPNRADFVKVKKLCFNCLKAGHQQQDCRGTSCRTCNLKHHTLLHRQSRPTQAVNSSLETAGDTTTSEFNVNSSPSADHLTAASLSQQKTGLVFLQTALVPISINGETTLCRALLDSGSQSNLITENLVKRLGLQVRKQQVRIFGLGAKEELQHRGVTDFLLTPKNEPAIPVRAFVMSKLTNFLPSAKVSTSHWKHLPNLKLADPTFNTPSGIDLLIGAELYETVMLDARIKEANNITYRESLFGWVVIGGSTSMPIQSLTTCFSSLTFNPEENDPLKRFWEIEELPQSHFFTKEEMDCEQHFTRTTKRNEHGQFVVKLPFKENAVPLGDSFQQAKRRLQTLLRRLSKDANLYDRYANFIKEFLDLGHMEKIPESEIHIDADKSFYLPHHCVLKESSSTTKLRVVFDASAKTTSGVSLNDNLMLGPKVQKDLFDILIRFRFHKVALSADIAKMYRQILLDTEDKDFHRLLWKKTLSSELEHYRMTRNTYGVASAGFHAIRPLIQLAETVQEPSAALALKLDMYVDDLLTGATSIQEAKDLQDVLIEHLATAGFQLRKWSSSESSLVECLPESYRETADIKHIESEDYYIKTLGVAWKPQQDIFTFNPKSSNNSPQSKRQILSEVTRIFDPLGLLSPTVIQLKSFIQTLWLDKLTWDEPLNRQLVQQYENLSANLSFIDKIEIPRFILDKKMDINKTPLQLHVFCDASTTAYAAAAYIRQPTDQGTFRVQLLVAKTKVAPIRTLCVPRLELCAALLGAQLVQSIVNSLEDERFPTLDLFAWTDSTITLAWIKEHPSRWKTFVANRVAKIQNVIPAEKWKHVPTESNPADCASRGMSPQKLKDHNLWWQGPNWLCLPASAWPDSEVIQTKGSLCEAKKASIAIASSVAEITQGTATPFPPSFKGSQFLTMQASSSLNAPMGEAKTEEDEEIRQDLEHSESSSENLQVSDSSISPHNCYPNAIIKTVERFSSFRKLVNVLASVLRFVSNIKKACYQKRKRNLQRLPKFDLIAAPSAGEIEKARNLIFRAVQEHHLPEFHIFKLGKQLPQKSSIRSLTPFFDEEKQVLRVGGRLANSTHQLNFKFPIIVPRQSVIAPSIIRETHLKCLHGGWQLTLSTLRQTIWIPNATRLIRSIIRQCPRCARFNSRQRQPQMGDLPQERISPSAAFTYTGLDYCGPITTKSKNFKVYVAIFICFSTKAVHLELVQSLTKEACLATLQRFFARRGLPIAIYSDNSRTFTGAHAELELQRMLTEQGISKSLQEFVAYQKIQWLTIPPRSPHFGGLWEAAVKSFKRHLMKTTGKTTLTIEDLTTLLNQIEAIMNSRPLNTPSGDPNDFPVLTPAHFLIGRPLLAVPDEEPPDQISLSLLRRFQTRQQAMNFFWKRWSQEYLTSLQQRPKWNGEQENLKVGDIVFLNDDNSPPMMWPMAIVTKVFKGNDDVARVVEIRTRRGSYVRPVIRLSLFLPAKLLNESNQE